MALFFDKRLILMDSPSVISDGRQERSQQYLYLSIDYLIDPVK